jgi:hypothetical protein
MSDRVGRQQLQPQWGQQQPPQYRQQELALQQRQQQSRQQELALQQRQQQSRQQEQALQQRQGQYSDIELKMLGLSSKSGQQAPVQQEPQWRQQEPQRGQQQPQWKQQEPQRGQQQPQSGQQQFSDMELKLRGIVPK